MILAWMLVILIAGAFAAWLASRWNVVAGRWVALATLAVDCVLVVLLWSGVPFERLTKSGQWITEARWVWIPQIGVHIHLAVDGLSLLLVTLTLFLGIMAVAASWTEIQQRAGFFHFNLLLTLAGIVGVFTSLDMFLFYFFWELMLVPMYFLIILWGHENRVKAGLKFFLFTQAGGFFMLVSILALFFVHERKAGFYTFEYSALLNAVVENRALAFWFMMGFFAAFAVKLPVVPLHVWLPDAHTEAPTAGSVILSGLMLKTGAYGFLRFLVPFFPAISREFAMAALILGVVGILYGAMLAFAQTDLKRLVAYSSVSHMGFVLLGVYAWNQLALEGVVVVILAHGLSTSALFIMVGALQERIRTRDMNVMGGLWDVFPRMGGVGLFFALASLGLPGLANFVGEFLVLLGVYQVNPAIAIVAAGGLVFSAVYSLWLVQRTFYGELRARWEAPDLNVREMTIFGLFIAGLLWIGLYPQPVLEAARPSLKSIMSIAADSTRGHVPETPAPGMAPEPVPSQVPPRAAEVSDAEN